MSNDITFIWNGINKQGKRIDGELRAADKHAAELELAKLDVEIISISIKREFRISFFKDRIKDKDIVLFTKFLATMIEAGIPIIQGLDIVGKDQDNKALKDIILSIKKSVSAGTTLADALSLYPNQFDALYCNLVKAGEKSGSLDIVLKKLSEYLDNIRILKSKIRHALIYPITIVLVAISVSLILLVFVVPQFQVMFSNAHIALPMITQMVINVSDFVRKFWLVLLGFVIVSAFMLRRTFKSNERFQYWVDKQLLKIYLIGTIIQKAVLARFTGTLAITLTAGLPIIDAMKIMVNIMGNKVYEKAVQRVCEDVTTGFELSKAMAATNVFPNMTIQMVSVGEVTGHLPEMLTRIAQYYQEDVNNIADNLSALLEPIIIVVLGAIIGVLVVAMYMPIFKIGTTIA